MVGTARLVMLCLCGVALLSGCQSQGQRTTPGGEPVVRSPEKAMPAEDTPPTTKNPYRPAVPDEDKAALIYHARLDLLRLLICSQESVQLSDGRQESDVVRNQVAEHFIDLGFRVVDGSPCPDYDAPAGQLSAVAKQRDVDMFILLRAQAKQYDKFGSFYSFEAEARGKVSQITDTELLTMKTATVRGKRENRESVAAELALAGCGRELAQKLSDEVLRKSARGILLRRIEISGLPSARHADYVRVGLVDKPGIESVSLSSWDQRTQRAVFWVRMNADVKENLAAYLEQIKEIPLKVERLDKTDVQTRRKGPLE